MHVHDLLSTPNANKSSIHVPNRLIEISAAVVTPIITQLYNESIVQGVAPDVLKIARVSPIYKSGADTDPTNYRPISTLSPFSKVLEKLVQDQLESFLEKHSIIFQYQFSFCKGHSTKQAILEITDYLKTSIDNKNITCGLFLDLSKAFDTINHEILLNKLSKYGIRGTPLAWFRNFLSNRKQYVQIGNTDSDLLPLTCGLPRGSTLSPSPLSSLY